MRERGRLLVGSGNLGIQGYASGGELFTRYEYDTLDFRTKVIEEVTTAARRLLGGDAAALYAIQGPNGAIWLWPERIFEEMAGDIPPTLLPASELMDFDEITFPEARRLESLIPAAFSLDVDADRLAEQDNTSRSQLKRSSEGRLRLFRTLADSTSP